MSNISLNAAATPEELSAALETVLEYINPILTLNPNPLWHTHCPAEDMDGNYDDAYEAGEDNGEAYAAGRIRTLLAKVTA